MIVGVGLSLIPTTPGLQRRVDGNNQNKSAFAIRAFVSHHVVLPFLLTPIFHPQASTSSCTKVSFFPRSLPLAVPNILFLTFIITNTLIQCN